MKPRIVVVTHSRYRGPSPIRKASADFEKESMWLFVIELLLFGLFIAISTWPIIDTAEALRLL